MLKTLSIKNIALISQLSLDLQNGLNILTGETGAGKSIIIDSLNFVLGDRSDKSLIRYGTDEASVEAVFEDYSNPEISEYLSEMGIDEEEILIITRKMKDTKNECRINGKMVTLSMLRGLTSLLVDIHGQHEHQKLLNVSSHIILIDALGDEELFALKNKVKYSYNEYMSILDELDKYGDEDERMRRLDILAFQIDDITQADIKENEEDTLIELRHRLRNTEKIINALKGAYDCLDGSDKNIITLIKQSQSQLNSISNFGDDIINIIDRLDSSKLELKDIADTLDEMISKFDHSEAEADKIDERISLLRALKRKYGATEEAILEYLKKAEEEFNMLDNAKEKVEELQNEKVKKEKELLSFANELTKKRKEIAAKFEKDIILNLKDLGMSGTTFKVEFKDVKNAPEYVTANGIDDIEFLISPNIGEPLKPLSKIISGGEMSRFMLAIKNIIADKDSISTMVFDEIDTGISGNIMTQVAMKMCSISRNHQVIAVTHMPSLCSMADTHFLIEKQVENDKTITHVYPLDKDGDINEIARLIGGASYSDYAIPHAKEMKKWADDYKASLK